LWLQGTEKVIQSIATHNPYELLGIMEKLVDFWKKGVFIGSPKKLFETFRLVSGEKQRAEIKRKFQTWYILMKKLNPRLEKVDWT